MDSNSLMKECETKSPEHDLSSNSKLKSVDQDTSFTEISDIDLLMIGKTGGGKSSLGNTILQRKAFKINSILESVKIEMSYQYGEFNGRIIKIVEGPGIGDTCFGTDEGMEKNNTAIQYAINANPRGYHAFLLVIKFGQRFTAEDRDTIIFLKKIFGESLIKKYTILVMTNGGLFKDEIEETGLTFEQWCAEQEGIFSGLLDECKNRIIVFNNREKDKIKNLAQISKLIEMVDKLSSNGNRYTDENFAVAQKAQDKLMIEAKIALIQEAYLKEMSLMSNSLKKIDCSDNPNENITKQCKLL